MRTARLLVVYSALLLGTPAVAGAQETGKTGVTMAYPGAIGVIWHASDSVAIRPDFAFNHSSSSGLSDASGWGLGFNVSVLFYLKKYDNVRTYVSPRFAYSHSSSTSTPTSTQGTLPDVTSTSDSTGGTGAFGAQFSPTKHFSVYGELGLGYSHRTSDLSVGTTTKATGSSWGTVAGVGVVFYP